MPFASTFAFIQPWLLVALIGLPALWFLLRVTPPSPKRVRFPGLRLLQGLTPPEETPARTPLWLMLLRMAAAALVILGLAGPTLYPAARLSGSGPLVLVIDTGWAAGKAWPERIESARAMLDRARRDDRRVILLTTAQSRTGEPIAASQPMSPRQAGERLGALEPRPWPRDLQAAREAVADLAVQGSAHAVWLADGLDAPGANALATALQRLGRLDVRRPDPMATARIVRPPSSSGNALTVPVRRAGDGPKTTETVLARAADGTVLGTAPATFAEDASTAEAELNLPLELRNRVARVELRGEAHAGAVALLDARWRRHPVGLADGGGGGDTAQPLLSELYYIERALQPYAKVERAGIGTLLERDMGVLVLADRGPLADGRRGRVGSWVDDGGVLLRFAGPKLADSLAGKDVAAPDSPLLPVPLRRGGRALGGAMSWSSPATLAPFPGDSPFAGIDVPRDVEVRKQVLAEPSLDLDKLTWARLADGTPLVTAKPRGQGWVVLVHTTANTRWSNLPLSGVFVEMLRRISAMGAVPVGGDGGGGGALAPHFVLDGFGERVPPPDGVRALSSDAREARTVSPANPPGLYGPEGARRAHNLGPAIETLEPLTDLPPGVVVETVETAPETRLGPWLLTGALLLLLADLLIGLWLRGLLPQRSPRLARGAGAGIVVMVGALSAVPDAAAAQDPATEFAKKASLATHLAFVKTGQTELDEISRQGLRGLGQVLARRTAVEPGDPMGVDLRRDPLDVFPLLYWPVTPRQPDLTSKAARKVNDFLASGGTILFDLREPTDASTLFGRSSRGSRALQRLTRDIDMPPLRRVGGEHVLTKAFYLLQDFPGRYQGGNLWVEDTREASGDGVASVIIGSSDWARAWAVDEQGRPRFAVTPGGERQREMARRVGVNVVMYALTGNYKADQVHVPAILERLGQ